MNTITNRQAICDVLLEEAKSDRDIVVACSDSRGSASLAPFAQAFPEQFVEMGIAEQNLVTVSAGMAAMGKKVFAASPASFLSTRSYEQAKVDVAYSNTNVTLVGISGGVSYGALGMTHHSCQDIAAMAALPGMRVYLPSDRFQTAKLIRALLKDQSPAYVRVSRSATEDVYGEDMEFALDRANIITCGAAAEDRAKGGGADRGRVEAAAESLEPEESREYYDASVITCGDLVPYAVKAMKTLKEEGIRVKVIDMYCIKPLDEEAVLAAAKDSRFLVTAEEHAPQGGLGSLVCQLICEQHPMKVVQKSLPDGHIIAGSNKEIFAYYGLDDIGICKTIRDHLR